MNPKVQQLKTKLSFTTNLTDSKLHMGTQLQIMRSDTQIC
jgi:hypothetical protein